MKGERKGRDIYVNQFGAMPEATFIICGPFNLSNIDLSLLFGTSRQIAIGTQTVITVSCFFENEPVNLVIN